jgi:hypothetical protein
MKTTRLDPWLGSAVLGHLLITILHGASHSGAHVEITRGQSLFVLIVILIGPVAGLVVSFIRPRAGGLLVAATMAAALVFGLVNHFIIVSPDHVTQVTADWRPLFTASALALVASEAAGVVAGLRSVFGPQEAVS